MNVKYVRQLFENLSYLIEADMNTKDAIDLLQKNTKRSSGDKKMLSILSRELSEGYSLDVIFERHKKVFGKTHYIYVRSGLKNGDLALVLRKLALRMSDTAKIKAQLIGNLIYPFMLILATICASIFIMTGILPQMVSELRTISNGELPFMTTALMNISDFINNNYIFIIISTLTIIALLVIWILLHRRKAAKVLISIPFLGEIIKNIDMINIFYNLSYLLDAKIPSLEALETVYNSISNVEIKSEFYKLIVHVKQGIGYTSAILDFKYVDRIDAMCIFASDRAGKSHEIFLRIAEKNDEQTKRKVQTFSKVIEPILLVIIGIVICILAFGIFMPIYSMNV